MGYILGIHCMKRKGLTIAAPAERPSPPLAWAVVAPPARSSSLPLRTIMSSRRRLPDGSAAPPPLLPTDTNGSFVGSSLFLGLCPRPCGCTLDGSVAAMATSAVSTGDGGRIRPRHHDSALVRDIRHSSLYRQADRGGGCYLVKRGRQDYLLLNLGGNGSGTQVQNEKRDIIEKIRARER